MRMLLAFLAVLCLGVPGALAEDFVSASPPGGECEEAKPGRVCSLSTSANEASNTIDVSGCTDFTFLAFGSVTAMPQSCDADTPGSCSDLANTALSGGGDPFAWGTSDPFEYVRVDITSSGGMIRLVCGG